jgi:hypothetical protein
MPPKAAQVEGLPEGADAPMNQSREAHLAAWPLHSPEEANSEAALSVLVGRRTLRCWLVGW